MQRYKQFWYEHDEPIYNISQDFPKLLLICVY